MASGKIWRESQSEINQEQRRWPVAEYEYLCRCIIKEVTGLLAGLQVCPDGPLAVTHQDLLAQVQLLHLDVKS